MKKLLLIAIKDLKLIFRDPSALILMLLAPFLLTLGMGLLTGRFSGTTNTGFSDLQVAIVNDDLGELGKILVDVFQSAELEDLVEPVIMDSMEGAKTLVDQDQSAAMIHIPENFSEFVKSEDWSTNSMNDAQITFYRNPTQPTSAGIVRSILDQFIHEVEVARTQTNVTIQQLIENGFVSPDQASIYAGKINQTGDFSGAGSSSIEIINQTSSGEMIEFDILAYMAPGMAIMFLMFTVTYGGRSLLVENRNGTLARLFVAPNPAGNILLGKGLGIFLTAVAQLLILIGGTSLLFQLQWGDALGVLLLILSAAFAATGWGLLFASLLKTPGQVAVTGSAVMLLFGILGGSFFDLSMLPDWISVINKIKPNAWAIDGFYLLSVGGKLRDITQNILALIIMGILLLVISTILIKRRGLVQK
jgi:ABC-2 type transport system permease protein